MSILKCPCGANSPEVFSNVVGDGVKVGFHPVFSYEGKIIWLCGACFAKVHQLAKEIHEITKNEYIHFGNLLQER